MKKKTARNKKSEILRGIFLTIVGTLILSFGTSVFIVPFDLVSGGISGISLVLDHLILPNVASFDLIVAIVTWVLFFMGLLILGKSFSLKTLISTVIYPIGVSVFMRLATPDFLGGFFHLKGYTDHRDVALILATILGGACVGIGCSLTFIGGGSTGGVDIIAFTVCKIFKKAKSSVVLFIIDACIIVCGMFVMQNFVVSLLGIISAFISAIMVDKVFLGSNRSFIAQIISDKHEEINREIIDRVKRGTTVVNATGGYTGMERKMIIVSFTVNQYAEILGAVHAIDKNAFVTIHQAHEISGEGWTR